MKLLITTRVDHNLTDWVKLTHPLIRKYAARVGADFAILDEAFNCTAAATGIGWGVYQYRIMKLYDLHEQYDRIISFDSDMIISPNCPNLFDVVPYDSVGTIYEDVGSRRPQRIERIMESQRQFGDINWREGYINTGVFITSRCHRDIYQPIDGKYFTDWGTDDIHLGYQINKLGYKTSPLSYKFNHMTMFSEDWNGNPDRFDSHIIHYAGAGIFDESEIDENLLLKQKQQIDRQCAKLEQARLDCERWYR